jgi:hypothetical protein
MLEQVLIPELEKLGVGPQTLDIVDLAIHGVVCQKSDFHGNGDI